MRLETPVLSLLDEQNPAKNVVHGEEAKSKVREETPGNPWEPFGNPFRKPPLATHGHPFENKNSSDTLPKLRLFPNPIPSNVA